MSERSESPVQLSVVVPCYNEETRVPDFLKSFARFATRFENELFALFPKIEIILVNDGSTDSTEKKLRFLLPQLKRVYHRGIVTARVLSLPVNKGKGAAVRAGLKDSHGDWILMTDVDLSTPLVELFKLKGAMVDFAFGSRALDESTIHESQRGLRPQLGRLFNRYMRVVTGLPFHDTQCGFKLIRGSLAREIAPMIRENRFAFDVEMILLARDHGATFKEIPVQWAHREPSRVSPFRDGVRMAVKVTQFSRRFSQNQVQAPSEIPVRES